MIGAEGGFSEKEIKLLKENNAQIVSLGNRILRTETASIVCAGLAMQILETT
jgi:16S rRNA (uracil1498-N3)-methyltransferase